MQRVFVLDKNRKSLMPCHPARARELLRKGKAAVFRRYPFTIILKDREGGDVQPIAFKVDPGSKQTGIALVADCQRGKRVVWAAVLEHRGQQIKDALLTRRALRKGRRQRCRPDAFGFPHVHAPRAKSFAGFQTGDIVIAIILTGKYAGAHSGRVAVRFRPSFRLNGFDVHPKYLTRVHSSDGYDYLR